MSKLEARCWQNEISHHLDFSVKLVCYDVEFTQSPSYHNYLSRNLADKSVKLELRQRVYEYKTREYKLVYLPFIIEVTHRMRWKDLVRSVDDAVKKIFPEQNYNNKLHETPEGGLSNSGVKVNVGDKPT